MYVSHYSHYPKIKSKSANAHSVRLNSQHFTDPDWSNPFTTVVVIVVTSFILPSRNAISRSNESLMNTLTAATSYPCHGASQLSSFEIKWYLHIILSAQWKEKQNLKSGEWKLRRREWSSGSRSQYGRIGAENKQGFSHSSFSNFVENATLKSFKRFKLKRKKSANEWSRHTMMVSASPEGSQFLRSLTTNTPHHTGSHKS